MTVKSKKDQSIKADLTVTVYSLKTPAVGIGFDGYLKTDDNDWFKAVKNGQATITYTNSAGTRNLTLDQNAEAYGRRNYVYYTTEGLGKNVKNVKFAVERPASGDIYRIKVDGYKTVKLISKSSYIPRFNKADIE